MYRIRNQLATVSTSRNKSANSEVGDAPVGSRRELVANCVHTADADAIQLDSCVASASAVCIGLNVGRAELALANVRDD